MLDIILSFFGDFFCIYERNWKRTLTDWLFLLLSAGSGIASWCLFRAEGALTTVLAVICAIAAVCFFIKGGKHAEECIRERNS